MTRRLLDRIIRPLDLPTETQARTAKLLDTEWIVTNGVGGYASSSMAGVTTRRYHGILVAALPNPLGRIVMLNHLGERFTVGDQTTALSAEESVAGKLDADVADRITSVRLEAGMPVWEYQWEGARLEKRVVMPHMQNTVHISYCLIDGPETAMLELEPALHFRGYEDAVNSARFAPAGTRYMVSAIDDLHLIHGESSVLPPLRMIVVGADTYRFSVDPRLTSEVLYPVEQHRGYEFTGALWSPGKFRIELKRGQPVTLIASAEPEDVMRALGPAEATSAEIERRRRLVDAAVPQAQDEVGGELVLAADQFVITPEGRIVDSTRAAALGQEVRTVIAGYHWFTDWGRDTMISFEGLTLTTGRHREAAFILRTFAFYVRDGLIPNMFPDGSNKGLYHTADATLWFFHAVEAYLRRTGDQSMLLHLLPVMIDIVDHHIAGTSFGIGVDKADGLLREGAPGYQLTWMDAKVDDWVVTPRRGKPVEINALWYNALRLLAGWLTEVRGPDSAKALEARADQVYESFNKRFWIADAGYLYDVIDGDPGQDRDGGGGGDSRLCRPNQIFAISLDHPVLDASRWESVVRVVADRLVTPVGLRSLARGEPGYRQKYDGDLRSRDAAYHQGTVWGWLIGPWVDAWLKVHPGDLAGARQYLSGCVDALGEFGLGTIGEVFDAEAPYTPRGCIAQAWSVAETLRCWVKTAPADQPTGANQALK